MTVRVTNAESGQPIRGATVTASAKMTVPHVMTFPAWPLSEQAPGTYQARVDFLMPADWTMTVNVSGANVAEASATYRTSPSTAAGVPVSLSQPGRRDLERPWLYPLAALACVGGVLLLSRGLGRARRPREAGK
jgi:hypothetical protein